MRYGQLNGLYLCCFGPTTFPNLYACVKAGFDPSVSFSVSFVNQCERGVYGVFMMSAKAVALATVAFDG